MRGAVDAPIGFVNLGVGVYCHGGFGGLHGVEIVKGTYVMSRRVGWEWARSPMAES